MNRPPLVFLGLAFTILAAAPASGQSAEQVELYQKAREAILQGRPVEAIQHALGAIAIDSRQPAPYQILYNSYLRLGRFGEALEANRACEERARNPELGLGPAESRRLLSEIHRSRTEILLSLGEYEEAEEAIGQAGSIDPSFTMASLDQGFVLLLAGRVEEAAPKFTFWMDAVAKYPAGEKRRVALDNLRLWRAYLGHAEARRLAGDAEGAAASLERLRREMEEIPSGQEAYRGFRVAYLALSGRAEDLDAAIESAQGLPEDSEFARYGRGVLAARLGLWSGALSELDRFAERAVWPEAVYQTGIAQLRLGRLDRASEALTPLLSYNPVLKRRFEGEPENEALASRRREWEESRDAPVAARVARGEERRHLEETLAQIDSAILRYRFAQASRELEALRTDVSDASLARRIEERLALARALSGVLDRVIEVANGGALGDRAVRLTGSVEGRVLRADSEKIRVEVGSGWVDRPWVYTPYEEFASWAEKSDPSAEDLYWIGVFLWRSGDAPAAERFLARSVEKGSDSGRVARFVAEARGVGVPEGGFVPHRGRLVTAEEKENLEKGLVRHGDGWATPEDRAHLRQGHEKVGGKWIPLTAAQLEARGWRKVDGEWLGSAEVLEARSEWAKGWTREGRHVAVKTNESEAFAEELASAADAAYEAFRAFFGRDPGGEPLRLYAFKDFADYREYCLSIDKPDQLGALGFAPSESRTACGYDKFDDGAIFLGTMIHEYCHLFFWETYRVALPSWLAEGMATYFEAHARKGGTWTFGELNRNRLDYLRRSMSEDTLLPLDRLFSADAGTLIQQDSRTALTFYAQAWGVFFYFQKTTNAAHRQAFAEFLARLSRGQQADLLRELGTDAKTLEKDLLGFWKGL